MKHISKNCTDIKRLSFEWRSEVDKTVFANSCLTELSNSLAITRSKDSQNELDRLLCCLKKISTAIVLNDKIVNVTFAIIDKGGNKMTKKIDISKKTDELVRRMSKMGETYDDVIRRGFAYLDSCSEFWNKE